MPRRRFTLTARLRAQDRLTGVAIDAALSNTADFIVGKDFVGAVDFLRVCRSTLAESKTSIDELYAWEFGGPFLSDFTGRTPAPAKVRDAGRLRAGRGSDKDHRMYQPPINTDKT